MAAVDVFAEIVPGVGAGGFLLGQTLAQVQARIGECESWRSDEQTLHQAICSTSGWLLVTLKQIGGDGSDVTLYYGNGALELSFDSQATLAYIRASSGYEGSIFGDVAVGSRLASVRRHLGLMFDDVDELFRPVGAQSAIGVLFFGEEASLEDEPDQRVTGIAVHLA